MKKTQIFLNFAIDINIWKCYNVNGNRIHAKNGEKTKIGASEAQLRKENHMKSTGVVRKVDELGRIVLPIELRKMMDINVKDSLEIFTDGDSVVLKKYQPACVFCGDASDVIYFSSKRVCRKCLESLKSFL